MTELIKMKRRNGRDVYINPAQVTHILATGKETCTVYVASGEQILIGDSADLIAGVLADTIDR